jgi:hypothetical protein
MKSIVLAVDRGVPSPFIPEATCVSPRSMRPVLVFPLAFVVFRSAFAPDVSSAGRGALLE